MKPNALCVLLSAIALAAGTASGAEPAPPAPTSPQLASAALHEVLRLEIMHDYFADGRCSACRVVPSAETAGMLRHANAVFRAEAGGALVAAPSADLLGARLTFEVHASDLLLASVTATGAPGLSPEVVDVSFPPQPHAGAWAIVTVAADADAPLPVAATVSFSSREARWRWIVLLPGDAAGSLDGWTVRRESARETPVDHDPAEATELQDGRPAWQITLRAPLPLRERQPADRTFLLVPPPGTHGAPLRLPSPAPDGLRQLPSGELIAEIFVFL